MQRLQAAVALHNQGELDQAEAIYRGVLDVDADNFYALNFYGCICREKRKFDEGIDLLSRATILQPDNPDAVYNLGNVFKDTGRWDDAIFYYEKALSLRSDYPEALINLGNCLQEVKRYEHAEIVLKRAVSIQPGFVGAWLNLGNTFKKQEKLDEAITSYRKAIELNPDFAGAKKALLLCQGENGIREQVTVDAYREQMEGNDEAGILIAAYPSFEAIPSSRRSVNSWLEDKNDSYLAGQMFANIFVDLPWVKAKSFAESSGIQIPDAGGEYLDAVDVYRSQIKTLQIRMFQAPVISSLVEYVARKKAGSIDVIDVGGWSGNALFLAGFNDSWDIVKTWEVVETNSVCGSARDQLPGMLDSLPDDSAGKRNFIKLSFTEIESFYGESVNSQNVDLIWSSTAQHYNVSFPSDLDALLSRGAQVVYFDTLPYLCSSNPSLNVCEISELGVNDQNVYFLMSQQYLSSLILEASQKHGYSYKFCPQYVEPRLVFWQPQEGDKVLPKKVKDDAKPLLMKVCSIRFDKLD